MKDRNAFDVMNNVNVNVETMDMSDEEKRCLCEEAQTKDKDRWKRTKPRMEDCSGSSGSCSDLVGRWIDICGGNRFAGVVL